jgi:hypothetical protein
MRSRSSSWLTSLCASFVRFVGQKLNAVGEIIALQLERSYPDAAGQITSPEKRPWRSPMALLRLASWPGKRTKLSSDSLPPVQ